MNTLRYIAVLSLTLCGFWGEASTVKGDPPFAKTAVSDTTEPSSDPTITLFSDTSQLLTADNSILLDTIEDETDPPNSGTAKTSPLESIEDTPAGELYDDWDTTSVHAEKFDALTFNDTIRIPLNDPGHCNYVHPFNGTSTSSFGFRKYRYHFGVDINLETGDTVRCAFDGKVRIAQRSKTYGYVVVVRHNNGLETYYAHLSRLTVSPGDDVEAGMILGLGGNTGHSYGSHLHFEVRFRGIAIDPNYLIDFKNQTLRTDTYCLTKSDFKYLTEQYKVRHYSRKRKKTWYTYYCPGGANYSTKEAKAIMAQVPAPLMPNSPPSCVIPENGTSYHVANTAPAGTPKNPAVIKSQQAKSSNSKTQVRKPINGSSVYHTVKSGDTLYGIAMKYHTTVPKLCALNGMKANATLSIGKKLKVK